MIWNETTNGAHWTERKRRRGRRGRQAKTKQASEQGANWKWRACTGWSSDELKKRRERAKPRRSRPQRTLNAKAGKRKRKKDAHNDLEAIWTKRKTNTRLRRPKEKRVLTLSVAVQFKRVTLELEKRVKKKKNKKKDCAIYIIALFAKFSHCHLTEKFWIKITECCSPLRSSSAHNRIGRL